MIGQVQTSDDLSPLLSALCDGTIDAVDFARLERRLETDSAARRWYIAYLDLHGELSWDSRGQEGRQPSEASTTKEPRPPDAEPIFPPILVDDRSAIHRSSSPLLGSFGGWALPYMVATVITGVMLLAGWAYKISHYQQIATGPSPSAPSNERPESAFVGRVTGMNDCRWADPRTATYLGSSIPMNRKYALSSGLMEITYHAGAKVILEGPCTYEVESAAGGYLTLGKLTARVESAKPQAAKTQDPRPKTQDQNHKYPTHQIPSSLIPHPSSLFSVRTPSAIVTDLGTEFGVEVAANGATESHVIRGNVDVQVLAAEASGTKRAHVEAGQAVRVERDGKSVLAVPFASGRFVRQLTASPDSRAEEAYLLGVLADKPLGYWPLNEPAYSRAFRDRAGNGFHGAAIGGVSAGRAGPLPGLSRAVEFSGDGYIDLGRRDRFALTNNFTVEAWIWIDGLSGIGQIISAGSAEARYQSSGWNLAYSHLQSDRKLPYLVFSREGVGNRVVHEAEIPERQWAHVAYVFATDNTATVYVNGRKLATLPPEQSAKIGPTWVTIGFGSNMGGEYWRGRLAHVAVYPAALGGKQINNHVRSFTLEKEHP